MELLIRLYKKSLTHIVKVLYINIYQIGEKYGKGD